MSPQTCLNHDIQAIESGILNQKQDPTQHSKTLHHILRGNMKHIKVNIFDVPKWLGLKLLDLLMTWKHILVIKIDDGLSIVTGQFQIKRETTELNVIEWYEGHHCSVIKMVL